MPLTLKDMQEARKLTGLKWICCECKSVNAPAQVDCCVCGKQRWQQLRFSRAEAVGQAMWIAQEGHGL